MKSDIVVAFAGLVKEKSIEKDVLSKIIEDILSLGDCDLPKIYEHEYIHNEIFSMFNQHIYKITGKKHSKCPIT